MRFSGRSASNKCAVCGASRGSAAFGAAFSSNYVGAYCVMAMAYLAGLGAGALLADFWSWSAGASSRRACFSFYKTPTNPKRTPPEARTARLGGVFLRKNPPPRRIMYLGGGSLFDLLEWF